MFVEWSRGGWHTLGTDAHLVLRVIFEETLDTSARELLRRTGVSIDTAC